MAAVAAVGVDGMAWAVTMTFQPSVDPGLVMRWMPRPTVRWMMPLQMGREATRGGTTLAVGAVAMIIVGSVRYSWPAPPATGGFVRRITDKQTAMPQGVTATPLRPVVHSQL